MRENKFRFWDKETNTMMGPNLDPERFQIISYDGLALIDTEREDEDGYPYQMDVVFLEYTSLTDRNKTPIYEGDIVKQTYHTQAGSVHDGTDITFDGHHIGPVVITARGVCLKNPLHYSEYTDETNPMNAYKQVAGYRSEVIGNVFQHPHLLKE